MKPVLLDFNGTLFSDTCFHMEAWSEIYRELHENTNEVPDSSFFCGPRNDDIIHAIAPDMPRAEREQCSVHKEALYRSICRKNPDKLQAVYELGVKDGNANLQKIKDFIK